MARWRQARGPRDAPAAVLVQARAPRPVQPAPVYAGAPPALTDTAEVLAEHAQPEPDGRDYAVLIRPGCLSCADALTLGEARQHARHYARLGLPARVMRLVEVT